MTRRQAISLQDAAAELEPRAHKSDTITFKWDELPAWIDCKWDKQAQVWYVHKTNLSGLSCEGETLPILASRIEAVSEDLGDQWLRELLMVSEL